MTSNFAKNPVTFEEVYNRLCEVLKCYENPGNDGNRWTEENKNNYMYENIVQIVCDIEECKIDNPYLFVSD